MRVGYAEMSGAKSSLKAVALAIVALLAAFACSPSGASGPSPSGAAGPSPSATPSQPLTKQQALEQLGKLAGQPRRDFLLQQVAKEGNKVVAYSSADATTIDALTAQWKKTYPSIDAQIVRSTSAQVVQKSVSESQAGRPVADVLVATAAEFVVLAKENILAGYQSPEAKDFSAEYLEPTNRWVANWVQVNVIGYNTQRAQPSEIPTTLEGFTNPALKGKLSMHANGARWVAGVLKASGETQGMDLLKRLAAQQPRVFDSNTALVNALGSGQAVIGVEIGLVQVLALQKTGAPVNYVVPDVVTVLPIYTGMTKDAPHPFGAALFYDWLLSKEVAESVLISFGVQGPRKDVKYPNSEVIAKARTVVNYSPELLKDQERFTKIFEDLFLRK